MRFRSLSRFGMWRSTARVESFCARIHDETSGLLRSSSQRYGSLISVPKNVSLTSRTGVSGGARAAIGASFSAVFVCAKASVELPAPKISSVIIRTVRTRMHSPCFSYYVRIDLSAGLGGQGADYTQNAPQNSGRCISVAHRSNTKIAAPIRQITLSLWNLVAPGLCHLP